MSNYVNMGSLKVDISSSSSPLPSSFSFSAFFFFYSLRDTNAPPTRYYPWVCLFHVLEKVGVRGKEGEMGKKRASCCKVQAACCQGRPEESCPLVPLQYHCNATHPPTVELCSSASSR